MITDVYDYNWLRVGHFATPYMQIFNKTVETLAGLGVLIS